jgi:hypothetical protein
MEAGCALNPNELIITNGATEAMYLSLQAVTKPGDTVAILQGEATPTNPQPITICSKSSMPSISKP